jgi:arsenite/tail-anchored protein-transporting ATPase
MDTATTPRVLFFSGKGGVGKTTLAGTASVRLGLRGQRVLVASTDPAHSLSDLFDLQIGGATTRVAEGVDAVEVDAPGTIDHMFGALGPLPGADVTAAIADLLKLASRAPGVDEIVSLDLLVRLVEQPEYDTVVLDTAPTGHTLRLLALPELMDRYFGRLLTWRGQIGQVSRRMRRWLRVPGRGKDEELLSGEELGEELAGARGRMQRLGDLLRDPTRCALVLVTIPEAMSVLETARTYAFLVNQGMAVAAIAVNMLQPENPECRFCATRRLAQLGQLERVRKLMGDVPILTVEHELEEPRGERALAALERKIWDGHSAVLLDG